MNEVVARTDLIGVDERLTGVIDNNINDQPGLDSTDEMQAATEMMELTQSEGVGTSTVVEYGHMEYDGHAQSENARHDVEETGLMWTELMDIQQADSEMDIDNTLCICPRELIAPFTINDFAIGGKFMPVVSTC